MRLPNFFLIGPPKSATTSLYRYLGQHPSVYLSPIKEPCFFAPEVVDISAKARAKYEADRRGLDSYLEGAMASSRDGHVLEWESYLKLFKGAAGQQAVGEGSAAYLGALSSAQSIASRFPDARIVALLRDPADRLFAHYAAALAAGITGRGFEAWVERQRSKESDAQPISGPVRAGRYGWHVRRFRASFPGAQLCWCLHDDFVAQPRRVLDDIFRFLGIDPNVLVNVSERHNVTRVPRWQPAQPVVSAAAAVVGRIVAPATLARARQWWRVEQRLSPTPADREYAIGLYREDILELQEILGRRLDWWLEPKRAPVARAGGDMRS